MKKLLTLILASAMILSLAACGNTSANTTAATTEPAAAASTAETAAKSEAPAAAETPAAPAAQEPAAAEPASAEPAEPAAPSASGSDSEAIKAKGSLVVGITDFEPMDYKDASGEWIGFDADLARAFAEKLGVAVEFVEIEWDNKILELNAGSIDCVWNGMTLTDEVTSAMDCSNAYCNNAQVVIVPAASADKYQDIESVKGLSFAVEVGSAGAAEAEANGFTYTEVSNQATALMEVKAGTAEAAIIDSLMAAAMVGEGTDYADLTYTVPLNSEEYSVGFRKGSDLPAMLNDFFKELYAAGTLQEVAETYNVQAALIPQGSDAAAQAATPTEPSGSGEAAAVIEKGTLVVGITDFEPMDYKDENGEWIGFDADLAKAFAESLGVDVEFIEIEWDNKVLELNSGSIDCVWNGMTLTAEVTSAMDCSNAYCNNAQVVVVPVDIADQCKDIDSVKELNFAVEVGSAGAAEAEANGFTYTEVASQANALLEVKAGTAEAAIIDSLMAAAMVGEGTDYENLTYTVALNSEEYGVGFRKGSDLPQLLNQFFSDNYDLMQSLAETYGVSAALIAQ